MANFIHAEDTNVINNLIFHIATNVGNAYYALKLGEGENRFLISMQYLVMSYTAYLQYETIVEEGEYVDMELVHFRHAYFDFKSKLDEVITSMEVDFALMQEVYEDFERDYKVLSKFLLQLTKDYRDELVFQVNQNNHT